MQKAKDSFYLALRTRLAALNPNRTVFLRGSTRPGIVVEEAEAPVSQLPTDIFVLRWTALSVNSRLPMPLVAEECQILYSTAGSASFGGLDRGRMLTEMDKELRQLLLPASTPKLDNTQTPAVALATKVFWTAPIFLAAENTRDRISRAVRVTVLSYQEQGETA